MSDDNNKGGPATLPPAFKGGQIMTDGRTANGAEQGGACSLAGWSASHDQTETTQA